MKYKKIGVVVADIMEYAPLEKFALKKDGKAFSVFSKKAVSFKCNDAEVIAVNCLIGKVNAALITTALIDMGCDFILNFGLSGGIVDDCIGKFIIPERFVEHDFDMTVLGWKVCQKPDQSVYVYDIDKSVYNTAKDVFPDSLGGTAVCGDKFITSKKDSDFFKNEFGAVSCDMETAAIASVCYFANIPYICLRRVSDGASEETVDSYTEMNEVHGSVLFEGFYKLLKAFS